MSPFKYKKAIQAINFFAIKEGGRIPKMKALKLIWLADRLHLRKYGRSITNDDYYALPKGPVASTTKSILEKSDLFDSELLDYSNQFLSPVKNHKITSKAEFVDKVLSKSDIDVLTAVFEYYGGMDEFKLSEYSHIFPEWTRFEGALTTNIGKSFRMNTDDFFLSDDDKNPLFDQKKEHLNLSKEVFKNKNC